LILSLLILCTIGFTLSFYFFLIEQKIKAHATYKPFCDISDKVSCSKALFSEYKKLIGVSNSLVGIAFYLLMFILALFDQTYLLYHLSLASLIVSAFLAYILYFKIKAICLICNALYIVNIFIFLFLYLQR